MKIKFNKKVLTTYYNFSIEVNVPKSSNYLKIEYELMSEINNDNSLQVYRYNQKLHFNNFYSFGQNAQNIAFFSLLNFLDNITGNIQDYLREKIRR